MSDAPANPGETNVTAWAPQPVSAPQPVAGGAPAAAPPKPAAPKVAPAKPAAKGGKDRRFFLAAMFGSWFGLAWTTLTASLLGMVLGTVRFLFPNVLAEPPSK